LVEMALEEDLRDIGDLTGTHFIDAAHRSTARVVSREHAVVSGSEVAAHVCAAVDPDLAFRAVAADGDSIAPGAVVAEISGPPRSLLAAERTLLNFMQRLSGVATATRAFAERIRHTRARLLDTRKTTPGWRELEKKAVLDGGGCNHRFGLFDA